MFKNTQENLVCIKIDSLTLEGDLQIPKGAQGLVLFAHGSGSGRFSPRNNFVAQVLRQENLGTFLFDLLTPMEDNIYENRFNIKLLTERLIKTTKWLKDQTREAGGLNFGFFGASTGAAAALVAAALLGEEILAIVSRGGRPDLVMEDLPKVKSPALLIVGGNDEGVLELNKKAFEALSCVKKLEIVPGASHLFEEPGALEEVSYLAASWFKKYLSD